MNTLDKKLYCSIYHEFDGHCCAEGEQCQISSPLEPEPPKTNSSSEIRDELVKIQSLMQRAVVFVLSIGLFLALVINIGN